MKKRILPILLVLVMLLSLLPAQVFAAGYTFDPNATIFTQNFTTETPRQNNLGDYFTVTSTPLSLANKTTTWNTRTNGTSADVYNKPTTPVLLTAAWRAAWKTSARPSIRRSSFLPAR